MFLYGVRGPATRCSREEEAVLKAGKREYLKYHLDLRRGNKGKQKSHRAILKGSMQAEAHKFMGTLLVGLCDSSLLVINLDWHR